MKSNADKTYIDRYWRLAKTSPVKIPQNAQIKAAHKTNGYEQLTFSWQSQGWRYFARWHSRLPGAKIVTKPSWRVDRIKSGHGFGKDVRRRIEETWSFKTGWILSSTLHKSAWRAAHHPHSAHDIAVVKHTHFQTK